MGLEDKLDDYICKCIELNNKAPDHLELSIQQYKNLNRPTTFRGIPIKIVENNEVKKYFTKEEPLSDKELEIINTSNTYIEYLKEHLHKGNTISPEFKTTLKSMLKGIITDIDNMEVI